MEFPIDKIKNDLGRQGISGRGPETWSASTWISVADRIVFI